MGIDLTVAIIRYSEHWWLAYDRLQFDRDYDLHKQLERLPVKPIPDDTEFQWYDDGGLESVAKDRYGSQLTYCLSGEFKKTLIEPRSEYNKAIIKFIQNIDEDIPIVFWWH